LRARHFGCADTAALANIANRALRPRVKPLGSAKMADCRRRRCRCLR